MRPLERERGERASTHSLSTFRPQSYYIICLLSKREKKQLRCWRYTYYSTKCFCWFAPAGSRWIYYSMTRGSMWTDGDDRKLLFSPLFSLSLFQMEIPRVSSTYKCVERKKKLWTWDLEQISRRQTVSRILGTAIRNHHHHHPKEGKKKRKKNKFSVLF